MKSLKFISLLLILSFVQTAYSAESLSTKIHSPYASIRSLGMGNAFTAVADDYSLIFANPAGFSKKKANEFQFTLAGVGVSGKTATLMKDLDTAGKVQGTDQEKADAISAVLEQYYGKALGGKVQAAEIFWVRKNWGVALIPMDLTVDMTIDRQLGPAIDLNVKGDTTLAYGYGDDYDKEISWGATAKITHRVAVEQSVSALELATDSNVLSTKRFKEGNAIDFDIGVMWSPGWFNDSSSSTVPAATETPAVDAAKPASDTVTDKKAEEKKEGEEKREPQAEETAATPAAADAEKKADNPTPLPEGVKDESAKKEEPVKKVEEVVATATSKEHYPLTFGLVMHNVLGGSFSKSTWANKDATEAPTKMHRVVDVGSQYKLLESDSFTLRGMVDFKNMMHPEANTFNKIFHAGLEADFSPSGWFKAQIRGGMNQMYYTAGATLLLGVINIDFATYGEEVGTANSKMENRVYAGKLGFNF